MIKRIGRIAAMGIALVVASTTAGAQAASSAGSMATADQLHPIGCPYQAYPTAGVAIAAGRSVFNDNVGTLHISGCIASPALGEVPIQRDTDCPYTLDGSSAEQQSRLVFKGVDGRTVQIAGCYPHAGDRIMPVQWTSNGCPVQENWAKGQATVLTRPAFVAPDGRIVGVGACQSRANDVVQQQAVACPAKIITVPGWDPKGDNPGPVTVKIFRDKIMITVPSSIDGIEPGQRLVLPCQPTGGYEVENGGQVPPGTSVQADREACMDAGYWHDLVDWDSFALHEWEWIEPEPSRSLDENTTSAGPLTVMLSKCVADPAHEYSQRAVQTGWQHHDNGRFDSMIMKRVADIVTDTKFFTVQVVPPHDTDYRLPYALVGTQTIPSTAPPQRLDCAAYSIPDLMATYRREDGSTMSVYLRPGAAPGPQDCDTPPVQN